MSIVLYIILSSLPKIICPFFRYSITSIQNGNKLKQLRCLGNKNLRLESECKCLHKVLLQTCVQCIHSNAERDIWNTKTQSCSFRRKNMCKKPRRKGQLSRILFATIQKTVLEKDKSSLRTKGKEETLCPGIRTPSCERRKCPINLVSPIRHYASYALKCTHQMRQGKTENKT